jgi:hypothetical protein
MARRICASGAAAFPVVEATIAGVHKVSSHTSSHLCPLSGCASPLPPWSSYRFPPSGPSSGRDHHCWVAQGLLSHVLLPSLLLNSLAFVLPPCLFCPPASGAAAFPVVEAISAGVHTLSHVDRDDGFRYHCEATSVFVMLADPDVRISLVRLAPTQQDTHAHTQLHTCSERYTDTGVYLHTHIHKTQQVHTHICTQTCAPTR